MRGFISLHPCIWEGRERCEPRLGAQRCEAASVLSALGRVSAEKERKRVLSTDMAEQGLCPQHTLGCLTPTQGGGSACTQGHSGAAECGESRLHIKHCFGP